MYCTVDGLIERFGESELLQLSDEQNTGVLNTVVIDKAITDASNEIDSFLIGRYELPLTEVPSFVEGYACDMARYRLWDDGALDQVTARYKTAIKYWRDISTGVLRLYGTTETGENLVEMESATPVFTTRGY
ncbi:MAG: DUF1320 domain-containing protein [Oleispira sp.]|nr:DUF1320 domain-containing protein [Oleispira sp.]